MPESLAKVLVHIVYSTKHRQRSLDDPTLRSELYAYNATVLKQDVDSPAVLIGGTADHLHALCLLSRKVAKHGRHQEIEDGNVEMDQETSARAE